MGKQEERVQQFLEISGILKWQMHLKVAKAAGALTTIQADGTPLI